MRSGGTGRLVGVGLATPADAELRAEREDVLRRLPDLDPHLRLLDLCVARLPEVMAGMVAATDVLFPGGSMALVEPIYRGNRWTDHFNGLMASALAGVARSSVEPVRILEIGAGTGGSTAAALAALDPFASRVSYAYTDVSPGFVQHGRRTFGKGRDFVAFRVLDIEREPEAQGFAPASFDIVTATNVLHATRAIAPSLAKAARLLRPGGLLLLNELVRADAFAMLTFGLLDGWWLFEDGDRSTGHGPVVDQEGWLRLLGEAGFGRVARYGWGDDPATSFACLFVAAKTEAVTQAAPPAKPPIVARATAPAAPRAAGRGELAARIVAMLGPLLGLEADELPTDRPFAELGVDSIVAPQLVARLNEELGIRLDPTAVFDHATVDALAGHVALTFEPVLAAPSPEPPVDIVPEPSPATTPAPAVAESKADDIAVIGLACRFPGAQDADGYWRLLAEGRSAITEVPSERWDWRSSFDPAGGPGKLRSKWGAFLEDHELFDAEFFHLAYREAALTSPQQRLFLECAWHALEDGGYGPRRLAGRSCGVFVGVAADSYGANDGDSMAALGNSNAILAARISYHLDLKGPSVPVDTACSASLTALHLACRSLRDGDCDMALAGGVSVLLTDDRLHRFLSESGMASPTGRCHTFSDAADGFVPGEGVGAVLLKPLARALADGDRIHGVIKGIGINQDGKSSGITAPNGPSQTALELAVWDRAGIDPRSISYVEAHGTGTPLGDPIEVNALTTAFRRHTDERGFCAIGSCKTNVGHTLTAAGVAGLIKILLMLRHGAIPPSLNFERPNPHIDFAATPFAVATALRPWERREEVPRRAALSSFGFSGTNVHAVIEEPPAVATVAEPASPHLALVSAHSAAALNARLAALADHLAVAAPRASDLAFTLAAGRGHFEHRAAVLFSDAADLRAKLLALAERREADGARIARCARLPASPEVTKRLEEAIDRAEAAGTVVVPVLRGAG